jgi:hypothetical protein
METQAKTTPIPEHSPVEKFHWGKLMVLILLITGCVGLIGLAHLLGVHFALPPP